MAQQHRSNHVFDGRKIEVDTLPHVRHKGAWLAHINDLLRLVWQAECFSGEWSGYQFYWSPCLLSHQVQSIRVSRISVILKNWQHLLKMRIRIHIVLIIFIFRWALSDCCMLSMLYLNIFLRLEYYNYKWLFDWIVVNVLDFLCRQFNVSR